MRASVAKMRVIEGNKKDTEVRTEELRILEALLFAADEPLDEKVLAARLPAGVDAHALLTELQKDSPRAASISFASPANGPCAPPAISPGC